MESAFQPRFPLTQTESICSSHLTKSSFKTDIDSNINVSQSFKSFYLDWGKVL